MSLLCCDHPNKALMEIWAIMAMPGHLPALQLSLDAAEIAQVQVFVLAERRKSLSEREWQFRLRGYGYGLRESGKNRKVTAVLEDTDLFEIDEAVLNAPVAAEG